MVLFLANRGNLQRRRLHDRIADRLRAACTDARRTRADPRDPGPYRVVGEVDAPGFLDRPQYPAERARVEIGFQLETGRSHEFYWFTWIEPDRGFALGWHQDDDHADLGPVHLQLDCADEAVDRWPAEFVDSHPLDVVERRLESLPEAVLAVEFEDGSPVGLDADATVVA